MARIYKVTSPSGTKLVRAANQSAAVRYVAQSTIVAAVAAQDDLVRLLPTTKVEDAGRPSDLVEQ